MDPKPDKPEQAKTKDANLRNEERYSAFPLTTEQAIRVALEIPEPSKKAKPSR